MGLILQATATCFYTRLKISFITVNCDHDVFNIASHSNMLLHEVEDFIYKTVNCDPNGFNIGPHNFVLGKHHQFCLFLYSFFGRFT